MQQGLSFIVLSYEFPWYSSWSVVMTILLFVTHPIFCRLYSLNRDARYPNVVAVSGCGDL
jgi:hypothetical protein